MPKLSLIFLFLIHAFAMSTLACAQDFRLTSVNLLHFGQEGDTAQKCAMLKNLMATNDLILVQEVMQKNFPCPFKPSDEGFIWQAPGPFGQSSYKEYFGFLYANTAAGHAFLTMVTTTPAVNPAGTFERTPAAALFYVNASVAKSYYLWVVDVHSVWGKKGVGPRQQEALLAGAYGLALKTSTASVVGSSPPSKLSGNTPVIFAGDWNIETNFANNGLNPGFASFFANGFAFAPNDQTSLTQPGGLSKRYDHFVFTKVSGGHGLTLTAPLRFACTLGVPTPLCQPWRGVMSDHLGISTSVTLQ